MTKTITLKALRPELPHVADSIESKLDRYIVTRHGQPVMMLISPEDYEGLLETIEVLSRLPAQLDSIHLLIYAGALQAKRSCRRALPSRICGFA